MNISYFHFCDYAFTTDNGKIGIIGIFDRIFSKQFPVVHGSMYVVGEVAQIGGEKAIGLKIKKGLNVLFDQIVMPNVQQSVSSIKTVNFQVGFQNFAFPERGVYDFIVSADGDEIVTKKLVLEQPSEG